jgi:hypothetical protein
MSRMAELDAVTQYLPGEPMNPLNELAAALAKAQGEMSNPGFDTANLFFKTRYASLAAVRNAVVPVLSRHGISIVQDLETVENRIGCTTILTHSSGQQMKCGPLYMPATKPDAQGLGSAATYARRYALMAVCGVVGDDDDDGNSATGKPQLGEKDHGHAPVGVVNVSPDSVKFADAFKAALTADDPLAVKQVHLDLQEEGEEAYRATWSLLDSKTRSAIKRLL